MMSHRAKRIKEMYSLKERFIMDLVRKGDYNYETGYYKFIPADEKKDRAINEWYDEMRRKRVKLLANTPYSDFYAV